jgi:hypothetical protein
MTGFCLSENNYNNSFFLNFSLTCNLSIPKKPVEGTISIDIKSEKTLDMGDTDISGLLEFTEKFKVYVSMFVF